VVKDRPALEEVWQSWETKFAGGEVPRPPHWGGYLLEPDRMEFWQGRPNRMHDRFRYSRQANGTWQIDRLAP
jgi:pyridoxamine 5'-phosphate oxidase